LGRTLAEIPLFSELDHKTLSGLAAVAELRRFRVNEIILHEGDTSTTFYLILDGQVEVKRAKRSLARMGRGQFFGETTLAADQTRSADVLATEETTCLVLSGAVIRKLLISNPAVALRLIEESTRRLRLRTEQLESLSPIPPRTQTVDMKLEFKSEQSKQLFDYFSASFIEDYMKRRLAMEDSGWRNLSEAAKNLRISTTALYAKQGRSSPSVLELMRRGLVESRTFLGRRSRGGVEERFRIAYEREPIKEHVKSRIKASQ
jgi:CRP-like cAMP-binding protein